VRLRICESASEAAGTAARVIAQRLSASPSSVLGLPTGRTVAPMYDALVRVRPDFSRARTFNLDEFVGVPASNPESFRAFMERHLFSRVNVRPQHVHFLNGLARDLDAECARFERAIQRAGGLDLVILGIGANGHIGFNEPGAVLSLRTHKARLTVATRRANAAPFGGRLSNVPREALSMGMGTILAARSVLLIATGQSKARAIKRMLSGRITTAVPASFLQLHPDLQLVLDAAAAKESR
jgi:glucosamine-6-phosphate deaminase